MIHELQCLEDYPYLSIWVDSSLKNFTGRRFPTSPHCPKGLARNLRVGGTMASVGSLRCFGMMIFETYLENSRCDVNLTLNLKPLKPGISSCLKKWYTTLEVNHHLKNGGSFWMMINPY